MPAYKRTYLKDEEKERFKRRLTHYLEDHTYKNNITHAEAGKKLGISANKFSELKSGGEQGRFLTSLDYLKGIANLEGLSIWEFVRYLEGAEADSQKGKNLYTWQDKIYKALENISITIRKKFADALGAAAQDDSERVELMCRMATAMKDKDLGALRSLVDAMEKL